MECEPSKCECRPSSATCLNFAAGKLNFMISFRRYLLIPAEGKSSPR